ncbi:MAG: hydroxymethylglutaryl-CoA reductase [Candidatus Omnitrophica bacterium]|jgi:hydroxymethylglutaryl-CoA reductase (NADPH)|nr:hydroxymethylglutaryl-CoA reductase [Candidatus Omnitrophota bacterium]
MNAAIDNNKKSCNDNMLSNFSELKKIQVRRDQLQKNTNMVLSEITKTHFDLSHVSNYIENMIGVCNVPLGVAGPIQINGDFANGKFYVPFATTQSTLIRSYDRGMKVLTASGGVNTKIIKDEIHISPVFCFSNLKEAKNFYNWSIENFELLKKEAESVTTHGKLLRIKPVILGRKVILTLYFSTQDAMGLNMIVIAADKLCRYISKNIQVRKYYLRSNYSADKKPSYLNFIEGYGKTVVVEATIAKQIIEGYLQTSAKELYDFWITSVICGIQSGLMGLNAHFANGLSAIFLACGQDIASVVNACLGIGTIEIEDNGDLYISGRISSLPIGTVGGATDLGTQKECLQIMDCFGNGKTNRLAEIISATLVAGEISIVSAIATGNFASAHINARLKKGK